MFKNITDDLTFCNIITIIRLWRIAVRKATGCINQENIRIHNYAKMQHMLKY